MIQTAETLTIAVVSDVHAYSTAVTRPSQPSYMRIDIPEGNATVHPFASLQALVKRESLRADVLVCCGDLGDRAEPAGIQFTWRWCEELGGALGAITVLGTAGNHDVDSRYLYNQYDAKGILQGLVPSFPAQDEQSCDRYWSRNFLLESVKGCPIVVLNSSAYHGGAESEHRHGRIAATTTEQLRERLKAIAGAVNVLVCHHHLYKYPFIPVEDYSAMEGAPQLLDALGGGEFGRWMVIHGHMHYPNIEYAAGTATSPIILSAGSLSAMPYAGDIPRNQFYLIDLALHGVPAINLPVAGRFRAWDWSRGVGWLPARIESGLPAVGGFGCRDDPATVATAIRQKIVEAGGQMSWTDVEIAEPRTQYLLPADKSAVVKELRDRHHVTVLEDGTGIVEVRISAGS